MKQMLIAALSTLSLALPLAAQSPPAPQRPCSQPTLLSTSFTARELERLPMDRGTVQPLLLSRSFTRFGVFGSAVGDGNLDGIHNEYGPIGVVPELVDCVTVIDAALTPEYGRATGGILYTTTRRAAAPFNASAFVYYAPRQSSYGAADAGVTIGGPLLRDRLFALAGYDRSRYELPFAQPAAQQPSGGSTVYADRYFGKAEYVASPHADVSTTLYGSPSFHAAALTTSLISGNTTLDASASNLDVDYGTPSNNAFVRANLAHVIGAHRIRLGVENVNRSLVAAAQVPTPDFPRAQLRSHADTALWLADRWSIGSNLSLDAGVRRQEQFDASRWEPRLSLTWQPTSGALRVAAFHGRYDDDRNFGFFGYVDRVDETLGELSLPRAGLAARLIYRTRETDVPNTLPTAFASTYRGAQLEWSRRFTNGWIDASYTRGRMESPFLAGQHDENSAKLLATATVWRLDLGAAARYENAVPLPIGAPFSDAGTAIDLHVGYPLHVGGHSITAMVDGFNVTNDRPVAMQPRIIRGGLRWRL